MLATQDNPESQYCKTLFMEPTVPKLHTPKGQRANSLQSLLSMDSQRNRQELHGENSLDSECSSENEAPWKLSRGEKEREKRKEKVPVRSRALIKSGK